MIDVDEGQLGRTRRKVVSYTFIVLTLFYGGAILFADQYFDIEIQIAFESGLWGLLLVFIFGSWFLRYLRWYYVLSKLGRKHPFLRGFVIYLSGFAYTATPGKGGELVRLRYLCRLGFSKGEVFAAFLYERSLDLLVVLVLACLAFFSHDLFYLSAIFVAVVVGIIAIVITIPSLPAEVVSKQRSPIALTLGRVRDGLAACGRHLKDWTKLPVLFASVSLGVSAWLLISVSFVFVLYSMKIELTLAVGLSAYPLSMLAGAASLLPGGVGATEASLAYILTQNGVDIASALSAAITIRLLTLWSAILVGALCVFFLELGFVRSQNAPGQEMASISSDA